jgi:hypothetical protein
LRIVDPRGWGKTTSGMNEAQALCGASTRSVTRACNISCVATKIVRNLTCGEDLYYPASVRDPAALRGFDLLDDVADRDDAGNDVVDAVAVDDDGLFMHVGQER